MCIKGLILLVVLATTGCQAVSTQIDLTINPYDLESSQIKIHTTI